MVKLSFLGAMSTVGASGILVETGSERIVLDHGTKIQELPPKFPLPIEGRPDAVVLSHCHLDHSGGLGLFFTKNKSCPIYAIDVTKPLTEMLLRDSIKISDYEGIHLPFTKDDVQRTIRNFQAIEYRKPFKIGKTKVTPYDAGHIPGSMITVLECDGKKIMYTSDFNSDNTRLLKAADTKLPAVDVLITESTYSDRDHPDREKMEKELIKIINDTLARDGVTLISSFAVGRTQEMMLILHKHGIDYPVYMDGMAKKATTIINRYNFRLDEPGALDRALKKVTYISSANARKRVLKNPCVILTTSGMLSGGPISWYLQKMYDDRDSSLILTGYQVEGTPGRTLLETGRYITEEVNVNLRMFVRRLDFSAHVGRSDLFSFIEKLQPKKVFCVHGDHTEDFARELCDKGFDAVAPLANNRSFEV